MAKTTINKKNASKGPSQEVTREEIFDKVSKSKKTSPLDVSEKDIKKYQDQLNKANKKVQETAAKLKLNLETATLKELTDKELKAAQKIGEARKEAFKSAISSVTEGAQKGIEKYFDMYTQGYSKINAALVGTDKNFTKLIGNIKSGLGSTTTVSLEKVIGRLNTLVEKGITYNTEERAFLAEISEKIAITFDATNGTLLRLIKLNSRDMTKAYLGMESLLNEFLNKNYQDTSYLANNLNETVSSALIEATASMGYSQGTALEYTVQQWLGAMNSSGVSDNFVNQIAQGLGYLGSGNINALSGNAQLNALFAAASNQSGQEYGSLMNGGLDAQSANQLLRGLYNLLFDIASSQDRITQNQYAQIFGVTMTDLIGMMNMGEKAINSISDSLGAYSTLENRLVSEINKAAERTSIKEKIDNAFSNVFGSIAESLTTVANGAGYITYMIADMLDEANLGKILAPLGLIGGLAFGTTFGDVNLASIAKTALIGFSALGNIGNILATITGQGKVNLSGFKSSETNSARGDTRGLLEQLFDNKGSSSNVSQSIALASTDGDKITDGTMHDIEKKTKINNESIQSSEEKAEITEKQQKENHANILNIYNNTNDLLNAIKFADTNNSIYIETLGTDLIKSIDMLQLSESIHNLTLINITQSILDEVEDLNKYDTNNHILIPRDNEDFETIENVEDTALNTNTALFNILDELRMHQETLHVMASSLIDIKKSSEQVLETDEALVEIDSENNKEVLTTNELLQSIKYAIEDLVTKLELSEMI